MQDSKPEAAGAPPLPDPKSAADQAANDSAAEMAVPTPEEAKQVDSKIDQAVDDITAKEADEVLAAEDAELEKAFKPEENPKGWRAKIKHLASVWWNNPKWRYGSMAGLAAVLLLTFGIPASRYFVLNNLGVRSSSSLTILDDSTQQPLKNVQVKLANQVGTTNSDGQVKLSHLKLGRTTLQIHRRAFADVSKTVTVGWGSNPLGNISLTPTGTQYTFNVADFLSGKALADAQANAQDASANADDHGKIVLTVDPSQANNLEVTISSPDYRDQKINLNLDDKAAQDIKLVPSQKHVFVSRQTGKYELYSIDVDGKNKKLILPATGYERSDMAVIPEPGANFVAVVSTRDNAHDSQGYLLSTLSIVDSKTGQRTDVAQSEKIQVLGWIGSRVIYVQIAAGASASNPKRERLMSYDQPTAQRDELASSNYFNDLMIAQGAIYYAPSDAYQAKSIAFYKINSTGNNRQTILDKEVWNIFRDTYEHFFLSVGQSWYGYSVGSSSASKLSNAPASNSSRLYHDSNDGKHSLWVDNRDGKGVLLEYDIAKKTDKTLVTQSGLTDPAYWLNNNYVIYRIHTDQQTADYVLNLDGGQPRKISDVTNTAGVTQWYYY